MNREKLKEVAVHYFKNELGSEPQTMQFTLADDGVREYNIRATMGKRIFDIYMQPFHNRIELTEKLHSGRFEDAAADTGYNPNLDKL